MNKIVKLSLILFLVCAVTAGILGVVNNLTAPRIAEIEKQKEAEAFAEVLPAIGYEPVEYDKSAFPRIDAMYRATDGSGYVVQSTFSGAQGNITMVIGIGTDYTCRGISIIAHSETSGLGANAAAASEIGQAFRAQFIGQGEDIKLRKSGGEIDALTGATITSKAVTTAVANAIAACIAAG